MSCRSLDFERWLGRQDSNLGSRDQNPLPYRLATPQRTCQTQILAAVTQEDDKRDDREDHEGDHRERRQDQSEHRHEDNCELGDGEDPRSLPDLLAARLTTPG